MMSDVPVFQNLRTTFLQPTWLAIFISVGLHGMLGISWPNLPFGNNQSERWKTVDIIELTPSEQRLLPNLSTPPAQLVIPPAPPVINTLPALPRDQSKVNLPKLPLLEGNNLTAPSYPTLMPPPPLFPDFSGLTSSAGNSNAGAVDPFLNYSPPPLDNNTNFAPPPPLDLNLTGEPTRRDGWDDLNPENAPARNYNSAPWANLPSLQDGMTLSENLPPRDNPNAPVDPQQQRIEDILRQRQAIALRQQQEQKTRKENVPAIVAQENPQAPPIQRETAAALNQPNQGLNSIREAQIVYLTWATQMAQDQQDLKIVNQDIVITAPFPKEVKDQEFAAAYVGVRVDSEGKFVAATPVTTTTNPILDSAAQNAAKNYSFPPTGQPTTYPVVVQFVNTPATTPGNTQTPTKPQPTQQPTPQRTRPPISRPGDTIKKDNSTPANVQTQPAPQPTPTNTQPAPQPTPTNTQAPPVPQPNVEQPPALPETPLDEPAGDPAASPENQQPPEQTEPPETEPTNVQPPATPVSPAPQLEYTPVPATPDTPAEESAQPSAETSPPTEESVNTEE